MEVAWARQPLQYKKYNNMDETNKNSIEAKISKPVIGNSSDLPITQTLVSQQDLNDTKSDLKDKLKEQNQLIIGVMIFVAITFLVSWIMIVNDNLRDKDMYLEYFSLQKDSIQSNYEIEIEVLELSHEIEMLKVQNYLK